MAYTRATHEHDGCVYTAPPCCGKCGVETSLCAICKRYRDTKELRVFWVPAGARWRDRYVNPWENKLVCGTCEPEAGMLTEPPDKAIKIQRL